MTVLSTEFTSKGSTFRQLKRLGKVALYSRGPRDKVHGYEVIRIKDVPETTWPNGNMTPAHEGYPGDNEFGAKGWYYMSKDLDGAEKRFRAESRRVKT